MESQLESQHLQTPPDAPLVSVVLPVAGPTPYLHAAIDSILQQTLQNFELLLISYPFPNGETPPWVNEVTSDQRIRWLQRQQSGLVAALNTGVAEAHGIFLARMDADDLAMPQRLETQLDFLLTQNERTIVGAEVEIFNDSGALLEGNRHYQQWLNSLHSADEIKRSLMVESPLPHPTWFARTELFRQLGGYQQSSWAEDYDLLLRADRAGVAMAKPETVLLRWRDHGKRLTHSDERYSRLNFTRAKAWALASSLAAGRRVIICGTGRNAVRLHDALVKEGVEVCGFVEHAAAKPRTSRRKLPVLGYSQLETEKPEALIVTAVTANGAREKLRQWFNQHGYVELRDYVIAG